MTHSKGLVIRFFMGAYALCDGKCPDGVEPEKDEIYIGNIVKMFDTWEEADNMRKIIDAAYSLPSDDNEANITPLRRVINCIPSHAWIANYHHTFVDMKQIIEELHANGYQTATNYGTTKSILVYKDSDIVAEIA